MKKTVLITCFCVPIVLALGISGASAHDLVPPEWRGLFPDQMTYQEWTFEDAENPAPPETIVNPFGSALADITLGDYNEGWFESLGGFGTQTGFWDIGGSGGEILIDVDNAGTPNPVKEIWVQVTYWCDIQQAPIIDVPGGELVDFQPGYLVEDVSTGGAWLLDVWVFEMRPNPEHEQIVIISDEMFGSVIDQIVVDTWCVPEPATLGLAAVGLLALIARARRK
jgi:hypothetical protein